ncbi:MULTISPECIES: aldehyde ferredoxin oxidoreductase family protein [unclassified Methanoculleus]|uniref:aldehyde ferredoxin oxidoreductase family protein n=1 Tax=unclassified Methanoculleus TaxID=2619537 RepID=UPI0025FB262C|nr:MULTISPECIES: aldehyde ferredoxin oxidoreductase family protein [unclassified Methanoculleus]MCK9318204.1 aldehyde ferredoxin oxidoreductase family protein [Methanoculleus sp.]MDD2255411.1 aldehyde ferredoxin oxidoreductase family protein [Methanoculleus sp.]MDD2788423.1 aldehyde ferredoxin oxidoreductase family protein [Methanoculleus sp.]MDD3216277.1 aldehyde ferredoxin oxidoreductase family protein [Methanoculleus sp.]MDD4314812.1 aldehyde ferredoxin oxidoreductase family protein [Methan
MNGYAEKILYVDLTRERTMEEPFPEEWRRAYIGGRGLGVRILDDLVNPGIDPLGPENVLVFATGPVAGSGLPLGSRYDVVTKSPLTGTLTSANSGGKFGTSMKRAGYDAVVILGRAERPVSLLLDDGHAEVRDASPLWGMTTSETTAALQEDLGDPGASVACIGPAGERLVRFSGIINETSRAAGRGGVGAVMGSKNVKAVAARGNGRITVADRDRFLTLKKEIAEKIRENAISGGGLPRFGTAVLVNIINENYILPTRNFQTAHFPAAENVSGERMADTILSGKMGCQTCVIQCGRDIEIEGKRTAGPEYETIWAFGPDCGIDDLAAVSEANSLCNDLGLDTISAGSTIACAMELSEKGYIDEEVRFGDAERMLDLVRRIAYRDGIGDELAEGSFRFARKHGHPELSMSVKRQELPAYDPRGLQGHGLAYATSVRGGDHVYGYMIAPEVLGSPEKLDPYLSEGKAVWTKIFQDLTAFIDSSGACLFTSFPLGAADYGAMVSAVTGYDIDGAEVLRIGERIWNMQKIFNLRAGCTREDDTLPPRLLEEPLTEGAPKGQVWEREPLLDDYYEARGWDREGRPTPEKLRELGIGEAAVPVP